MDTKNRCTGADRTAGVILYAMAGYTHEAHQRLGKQRFFMDCHRGYFAHMGQPDKAVAAVGRNIIGQSGAECDTM